MSSRWSLRKGHRRSHSNPVGAGGVETTKAPSTPFFNRGKGKLAPPEKEHGAFDQILTTKSPLGPAKPREVVPEITAEEEVAGLTALTMIGAREGPRDPSHKNQSLPAMEYEPAGPQQRSHSSGAVEEVQRIFSRTGPGALGQLEEEPALLKRTRSVPDLGSHQYDSDHAEAKQTLAYWKLETQLRLASDKLVTKDEEVASMKEEKGNLEAEMDELTVKLFEEAHEMVRIEKEGRHKDHVLLMETQNKSSVLQAELKALKALVEHMTKNQGGGGGGKAGKAYLTPSEAAAQAGEPPDTSRPRDVMLFNELARWHSAPSLEAQGSDFMKRIMAFDVNPCLSPQCLKADASTDSLGSEFVRKILNAIMTNMLVIETEPNPSPDHVCALTRIKGVCAYRVKMANADGSPAPWYTTSEIARGRVVALCNLFQYLRYIVQGLVKASFPDIYWKIVDLRLDVCRARLGLPLGGK